MSWLLVLGLKEGLVEYATVFVKSEVILMRIVKRSEDRAQPQLSEIIGEPSTTSNGFGSLVVISEGSSYGIINHGPTTECLEWIREPITHQWKCEMFAIN